MVTTTIARDWQDVAKEAQQYRDETIAWVKPTIPRPQEDLPLDVTKVPRELLTVEEVEITESLSEDLVESLAAGKLSSTTVVNAFLRRAGLSQLLVNCITELLPERALSRARFLDDYLAEHKKPVGPLHGLPISVKEHIGIKGLGLNAGFVSWWDRKAEDDADILKILWNAGAVFYARTTQPQSLMHLETSNNLYGVTVNPFNRNLTCGGSSGGEGALTGLRGSCLGIGSDIGGSIRSPAANNGIYGLRPTSFRLSTLGWSATMAGADSIVPVIGPLSTSLGGINLFMKTLIASKPWLTDPSLLPLPWKEEETSFQPNEKLKIAILWDDGVVKPHPPVTRALTEVSRKLQSLPSVEVVDWKPYKHDEAWSIIASLYFCDGGAQENEAIECSGEPWRPLSKHIIKDNEFCKKHSIHDLWFWHKKRDAYRAEYARLWNSTSTSDETLEGAVDVILCPAGPGAAPLLDTSKWWGYTSQWNLLDYPALVFPVSKVNPQVDTVDGSYQTRNAKDEYNWKLYDPTKFAGTPISLQLVGRRYEDERVLGILAYIKEKIGLPFVSYT